MLIEELKRQNKPYGYYFQEITGGFTNTGRRGIQAFKVIPLVVYRIHLDGKEELVRGADIVGTPLSSFAKIIAAGDKLEVFNGYCGAESGSVPVSAIAPAILVSELEIQKKDSSRDRPPILPAPAATGGRSGMKRVLCILAAGTALLRGGKTGRRPDPQSDARRDNARARLEDHGRAGSTLLHRIRAR